AEVRGQLAEHDLLQLAVVLPRAHVEQGRSRPAHAQVDAAVRGHVDHAVRFLGHGITIAEDALRDDERSTIASTDSRGGEAPEPIPDPDLVVSDAAAGPELEVEPPVLVRVRDPRLVVDDDGAAEGDR